MDRWNNIFRLIVVALAIAALVFLIILAKGDVFIIICSVGIIVLAIYYFVQFEKDVTNRIAKSRWLTKPRQLIGKIEILAIRFKIQLKKLAQYVFLAALFFVVFISLGSIFSQWSSNAIIGLLLKIIGTLKTFQTLLIVIAAISGFFVFFINGKKDGAKIEKDSSNEEIAEQERREEFTQRFPKINKIPLLRNFIRWCYKEGWGYSIGLITIILIGFTARFIGAHIGNINLDEGIHLYDAKLITEGFIPFRDYFTREPYYIYLLSFFVKIFGANLLTSRLISVSAAALTIFVIYYLGKNLFSKKIGFIAATIFSLSPSIIYNNYQGDLYTIYQLVLSICFIWLIYFFKKPTVRNIIILGFIFGSATHFYRLTVFYLLILGFVLGVFLKERDNKKLFYWFYLSAAIPFFLPLIYFSIKAGYTNFEIIYGTNELIVSYLLMPIAFLIGNLFYRLKQKLIDKKNSVAIVTFLLAVGFFIYSFFQIGIPKQYKAKIIFDLLFQNGYLMFFIFIGLFFCIVHFASINHKLITLFKSILLAGFFYLVYYGTTVAQNLENFGARVIPSPLKSLFLFLFSISLMFLFFMPEHLALKEIRLKRGFSFYLLLFFAPAIFYLIHTQWQVGNFMSFVVLGSIVAGLGVQLFFKMYKNAEPVLKTALAIILLVFSALPIYLYAAVPLRDRMFSQESRKIIEDYIKENTRENEEIFTNAMLFVVETKRRSVLNISRSTIYANSPVEMPGYIGLSKNLIPSEELANYIKNNVSLILIDNRTVDIFKENAYFSAIKNYYYLDRKWPRYEIEAWKKR